MVGWMGMLVSLAGPAHASPLATADVQAPTPGGALLVPDDVAAWMPLNNRFDDGGVPQAGTSPPYKRNPRKGLLIQLGSYVIPNGGGPKYDGVTIDGTPVASPGTITWINISSDLAVKEWGTPADIPPMSAAKGPVLYPGNGPFGPCYDDSVYQGNCPRKLHPLLEPQGVITYWTGRNGYAMTASYTGSIPEHLAYQFAFADSVRIEVYHRSDDGKLVPGLTFPLGKHTVRVETSEDHKHDQHMDPPWP
jgi:hypothetical protein